MECLLYVFFHPDQLTHTHTFISFQRRNNNSEKAETPGEVESTDVLGIGLHCTQ